MTQLVSHKDRVANIRDLLERMKGQIAKAAPRHLTEDRLSRVFMTSIQRTPKLAECTPESLFGCLMTCTQLGLEPDSVSGQAHLIPYNDQCTLIVGYKGLMRLARQSPDVLTIDVPQVVYAKDTYEFERGATPKLVHKPCQSPERGDIVAFYAVAHLRDGQTAFEWMWKHEVDKVRDATYGMKSGKSTPWKSDYEAMGLKTVVRRLCKWLPSESELQRAVSLDERADAGVSQGIDFVDISAESKPAPAAEPKTVGDLTKKLKDEQTVKPTEDDKAKSEHADLVKTLGAMLRKMDPMKAAKLLKDHGIGNIDYLAGLDMTGLNELKSDVQRASKSNA
jgi:recombination protein RecT